MLTNKEIAESFNLLAQLMELHGEDDFKIRSYSNAYRILKNEEANLAVMNLFELKQLKGIGDAIGNKIIELQKIGKMRVLEEFIAKTPPGVIKLFSIKGLGMKKISILWKELEIESPGELLYACNENRLISHKGFGAKTQQNIKEQLEYYFQSEEKYKWASVEQDAENILSEIEFLLDGANVFVSGQFRRLLPVVDYLEFVVETLSMDSLLASDYFIDLKQVEMDVWDGRTKESKVKVRIYRANPGMGTVFLIESTGSVDLSHALLKPEKIKTYIGLSEEKIFELNKINYLAPEIRDIPKILLRKIPELITTQDIKGVIHVHSTYSDGSSSLSELATYAKEMGYSYLGITDHSQSAFYANGLKPDRVKEQWAEIDKLNATFEGFKILKGIESDIKHDGSLDYDDELLAGFDFVIASVHSGLKMDKEKATRRLIIAIENPFTSMLGHPTGRLLLSRMGYPIDHKSVIEACVKNNVVIEINSNPLRLDLDYTWIDYAINKGVKFSINPDAHTKKGFHDIRYGIQVSRKGLMAKENCINCLDVEDFLRSLRNNNPI